MVYHSATVFRIYDASWIELEYFVAWLNPNNKRLLVQLQHNLVALYSNIPFNLSDGLIWLNFTLSLCEPFVPVAVIHLKRIQFCILKAEFYRATFTTIISKSVRTVQDLLGWQRYVCAVLYFKSASNCFGYSYWIASSTFSLVKHWTNDLISPPV